jgi:hypothetical protein
MSLLFRPVPGGSLPDNIASPDLVRALYFEKYHGANGVPQAVLQDLLRRTAQ